MDQLDSDLAMDAEFNEKEVEHEEVAIISPDESMDDATPEDLIRADDFEAVKKAHMPDLPDIEVDTETVFTWDIRGWRTELEAREHGPIFHCGEDPWRILFFPRGNNVDHASFYLEHGWEDGKAPEDWYACVQFMIVLWNPNDPTILHAHTANHRFSADESDWGFTRFCELRKLFGHSEDRPRPLVENDIARVSVYVRKMKDPTGVLWHNFNGYDSKKATGMVGLKNQGATCYLNSLLQSLYFTDTFRKSIYQIPTANDQDDQRNSAYALQRLFYLLQTSNDAVATNELTAAFGWDSKQIFEQQDVQELSRILMERMEEKMKGTEADHSLERMFMGKMKTYISCINVDYESSRIEDFWDLQLNVSGMKTLDDSFKDYVQVEVMDGENQYSAEGHGLQDARKGVIFETFPQVLHLQLKRFEYDFQRDSMMKINDRYEFPEVWDASPYLSDDADKTQDWTYHLHGVLVHSGDLNAGHYYAFLKPQKQGDFFKFDDERVTKALRKEAIDDNFGGEYSTLANGLRQERNPYTRQWSTKKSSNAYMLVYIRKAALDTVFLSDKELEPPPHLGQKFTEERELLERKRKEREEAHLYMEVAVSCARMFQNFSGFDIASWRHDQKPTPSSPKFYRSLKSMPIRSFLVQAAKDLDLDPEAVRAWVVVNRQNGTARPDSIVVDLDLTVEEIGIKMGTKMNQLRLWLEETKERDEAGQPLFGDSKCKLDEQQGDRPVFLYLKLFDAEAQSLLGVGTFYSALHEKVADMKGPILDLLNWPSTTEIDLFEEIKNNMIDQMKLKHTLQSSEIQEGDIVCVQKTLSEKQLKTLQSVHKLTDAPSYYDMMLNRIKIQFMPRVPGQGEPNSFELQLSKRMTYNQLAARVGEQLGVDPTHIRFFPVNGQSGRAKAAIRHTTTYQLGAMLNPQYNSYIAAQAQRSDCLYYEIMEFSLSELEQRKNVGLWWITEGIAKEERFDFLVPKTGTMRDVADELVKKLNIPEESSSRIRFWESHGQKVYKVLSMEYAVAGLNEFVTLYGELAPEEEQAASDSDRMVSVYQFDKEPSKAHGIPFLFLIKEGEIFKDTKERLSKRTGIKGKQLEKIKWAVVSRSAYSRPDYLEDEDVLSEKMVSRDDHLGMDHVNRKANWNRGDSIFIR